MDIETPIKVKEFLESMQGLGSLNAIETIRFIESLQVRLSAAEANHRKHAAKLISEKILVAEERDQLRAKVDSFEGANGQDVIGYVVGCEFFKSKNIAEEKQSYYSKHPFYQDHELIAVCSLPIPQQTTQADSGCGCSNCEEGFPCTFSQSVEISGGGDEPTQIEVLQNFLERNNLCLACFDGGWLFYHWGDKNKSGSLVKSVWNLDDIKEILELKPSPNKADAPSRIQQLECWLQWCMDNCDDSPEWNFGTDASNAMRKLLSGENVSLPPLKDE